MYRKSIFTAAASSPMCPDTLSITFEWFLQWRGGEKKSLWAKPHIYEVHQTHQVQYKTYALAPVNSPYLQDFFLFFFQMS